MTVPVSRRTATADNELGNGWGCYDLGLQNENLVLKAADLGLSTLIMGLREADRLREILNIPETETIVSVIAVGKAAEEPIRPHRNQSTKSQNSSRYNNPMTIQRSCMY